MNHKTELLAPAGNFQCLAAAVQNGADAVYIAGKSFGARSFAENFDNDELKRAIDYCHIRGVKVHVTVNTLVSDREFDDAAAYIAFLYEAGADAIIVQDLGITEYALKHFPEMEVHASTQMTIHNGDGVLLAESLGIKRTVLSRELSLKEISSISERTSSELEVFGHGALCMCYSGQCLMSSIIGGRSGNRGKCAQPCRLMYSVNGGKKKAFYLSLKDLCALEHLESLSNSGISSLKIEGRMKGAAYVASVVRIYRKYIDKPSHVSREDIEMLNGIFNRGGLTDGYLKGKIGTDMFAVDKPDNPYRMENAAVSKSLALSADAENKKLIIDCKIELREGCAPVAVLTASGDGHVFENEDSVQSVTSAAVAEAGETDGAYDNGRAEKGFSVRYEHQTVCERAQKLPLTAESVSERLRKTGGTPFKFGRIETEISGRPFMTAGEMNALRRNALEMFGREYADSFHRKAPIVSAEEKRCGSTDTAEPEFVCEVTDFGQYKAVENENFSLFYVPLGVLRDNAERFGENLKKTVVVLPAIIHENENEEIKKTVFALTDKGCCGVMISNLSQLWTYRDAKIYCGFRMNIFNSRTLEFFAKRGVCAAELSPELTMRQISELGKCIPVQAMAYGRLPLMVTENCALKSSGCPCKGIGKITDRMGMEFPVIKDGDSCRSVILNCKKTFTADKTAAFGKAGVNMLRIYFTDESAEECKKVCDAYLRNSGYRPADFTGAHYYKGVL